MRPYLSLSVFLFPPSFLLQQAMVIMAPVFLLLTPLLPAIIAFLFRRPHVTLSDTLIIIRTSTRILRIRPRIGVGAHSPTLFSILLPSLSPFLPILDASIESLRKPPDPVISLLHREGIVAESHQGHSAIARFSSPHAPPSLCRLTWGLLSSTQLVCIGAVPDLSGLVGVKIEIFLHSCNRVGAGTGVSIFLLSLFSALPLMSGCLSRPGVCSVLGPTCTTAAAIANVAWVQVQHIGLQLYVGMREGQRGALEIRHVHRVRCIDQCMLSICMHIHIGECVLKDG